ncbi:hypothetical protein DH2020_049366 [Rehmannia glutinosa]|uniref:DNA-directed RNA polymerase n=1 Tax=Rehmannia glutinosa TaxID=99300 RepID=A0ABR0U438_REHGL
MGAWDFLEEAGPSSKEKFANGSTQMEIDDDLDLDYSDSDDELGSAMQGLDEVFDSVGEITVEPSFDPSKKGDGDWRYASLKFGKVTLEHPTFFAGEKFSSVDGFQEHLKLSPRYARLQNMTYSSRIKVETHLQNVCDDHVLKDYRFTTKGLSRSDKFKTGVENFVDKTVLNDYHSDVIFGRLPVMYEGFRKEGNAVKHIEDLMKSVKSPPKESVEECIKNYLFPNLSSPRQKACLLAYMVKCLLEAYRGRRKVDNRDDLRNKRLELACELLGVN